LFLHPARDGFLDGDGADDARVTPFNERGAGGVRRDVVLKAERADLIGGATVGADDFRHGRYLKLLSRQRATRKTSSTIFVFAAYLVVRPLSCVVKPSLLSNVSYHDDIM